VSLPTPTRGDAALGAAGAVLAAIGVALAAYAAHATAGLARDHLQTAALFAFGHGVALATLPRATHSAGRLARRALLLGVLLFAGSLALSALAGTSTLFAPAGGLLMIAGWLLLAFDLLRR